MKRKTLASPEGFPPTRGKILKVGVSSLPSSIVGVGDPSRRAAEPPLEVLHISVWSLMSQGTEPPPPMPDDVGRGRFGVVGNEDSLLSHAELVYGAVSSIIRDSDLKKVDALSVEETWLFCSRGPLLYVLTPLSIHFLMF